MMRVSRRRELPAGPAGIALLVSGAVIPSVVGTVVIFGMALWALPTGSDLHAPHVLHRNVVAIAIYTVIAIPAGALWGYRWLSIPIGADATARRRALLAIPYRMAVIHPTVWIGAALLLGCVNAPWPRLAATLSVSVLVGATVTTAMAFWVSTRAVRSSVASVLTEHPPSRARRPGLRMQAVSAWAVGTGVPTLMVVVVAGSGLVIDYPGRRLALVVLILGACALVCGLTISILVAANTADPIDEIRRGMHHIRRGDFEVSVPVFDASELGMLQAGFNTMADGLREREQLRELFGRHVGREVAQLAEQAASRDGVETTMGGDKCEVAVLFVDLIGSTQLAVTREPHELVRLLNEFFAVVVDVVEKHNGLINKFEGDAALAVFGAPIHDSLSAGHALAAARELNARINSPGDSPTVGIGVSAGTAVAGNVGSPNRYEYTVIGDPVNEAARLTEVAKSMGGAAASGAALRGADQNEAQRWRVVDSMKLRGRDEFTDVAIPVVTDDSAAPAS